MMDSFILRVGLDRLVMIAIGAGSRHSFDRAEARFVGVPPHAFTSAPSRAIDNAVPIPIGRVGRAVPATRSAARAASAGRHTAERQKAASALSALRALKKRIAALVEGSGRSAHAFMVEAIARETEEVLCTGKAYDAEEVFAYSNLRNLFIIDLFSRG